VMRWVWKDFKTAAPEWLRDTKIMGFNPTECKGQGNPKAKKDPSDPDCWAYVAVSTCLADQKVGPKPYQLTIKPGVSVAVGIYILGNVCGAAVSVGKSGLKIAVKAPVIKLPGDIVIAHSKEKQTEGFDFSMELTPKKLAMETNVFIKLGFILEASTKVKIDGPNFEFEMSGKVFDLIEGSVKGRILMDEVKDGEALLQIANGQRGLEKKAPFMFEVSITAGSLFDKLKEFFGGVQGKLDGMKKGVVEEEDKFKKRVKEADEILKQADKTQLAEAKKLQAETESRWSKIKKGCETAFAQLKESIDWMVGFKLLGAGFTLEKADTFSVKLKLKFKIGEKGAEREVSFDVSFPKPAEIKQKMKEFFDKVGDLLTGAAETKDEIDKTSKELAKTDKEIEAEVSWWDSFKKKIGVSFLQERGAEAGELWEATCSFAEVKVRHSEDPSNADPVELETAQKRLDVARHVVASMSA